MIDLAFQLMIGVSLINMGPMLKDKHPRDISSLSVALHSNSVHKRNYAARELAFRAKVTQSRVDVQFWRKASVLEQK